MGRKSREKVRGPFNRRKAESIFQSMIVDETYKFLTLQGRETFKMELRN